MDIITRQAAREQGKKRFFRGDACLRGHVAERLVLTSACVECKREHQKAFKEAHPGVAAARTRAWAKAHPERKSAASRAWEAAHPERVKARCKARYERKKAKLAGRPRSESCETCGISNRRIVFDHCHASGKFRGWICDSCNMILGFADDNPETLRNLACYLEGHQCLLPTGNAGNNNFDAQVRTA